MSLLPTLQVDRWTRLVLFQNLLLCYLKMVAQPAFNSVEENGSTSITDMTDDETMALKIANELIDSTHPMNIESLLVRRFKFYS